MFTLRFKIKTQVSLPAEQVIQGFTRELFLQLNPPFPPVTLQRFDGCKQGDKVEILLNFLLFKQLWISEITEDYDREDELGFVDEGTKLPFFLSYWKHRHRIAKQGEKSVIIDDITYSGVGIVLTLLMFPLLYLQFLYRVPIYKKIFSA